MLLDVRAVVSEENAGEGRRAMRVEVLRKVLEALGANVGAVRGVERAIDATNGRAAAVGRERARGSRGATVDKFIQ